MALEPAHFRGPHRRSGRLPAIRSESASGLQAGEHPVRPGWAAAPGGPGRWLVLGVIALAQLMVVLDTTTVNIALPAAQHALGFSDAGRQWVVTAYALSFGSLLLLAGRLSDLAGQKVIFLAGLAGFAAASAAGGAATSFAMLVAARVGQGAFTALLAPAALSLLTTTFTRPKDRGQAFGLFGAVSTAGVLLGGVLAEYLSWRWCLYVNLPIAAATAVCAAALLQQQPVTPRPRLDLPSAALVSGGMFCLVYGFANAATRYWRTPSTWGFLAAGGALLAAFCCWQARSASPLLPPRIVLDRTRAGAYLSALIGSGGVVAIYLFLPYYLQGTLGYSPARTGVAFLPLLALDTVAAYVASSVLMPRIGPRPLIPAGLLLAAGAMAWLTRLGPHSGYPAAILGPLLAAGAGLGVAAVAAVNAGTSGVTRRDAGAASASVNAGQLLGGSIGPALLNTIAVGAAADYLAAHVTARARLESELTSLALMHGYSIAFWWAAGILACGAVVAAALLRSGPLVPPRRGTDGPMPAPSVQGRSARAVPAQVKSPSGR